jgi:hypothetical protein
MNFEIDGKTKPYILDTSNKQPVWIPKNSEDQHLPLILATTAPLEDFGFSNLPQTAWQKYLKG